MNANEPLLKMRFEDSAGGHLHQKTRISRNFWESPSLDQLAAAQNIQPHSNIRIVLGTWPGEIDDGFETAIERLRRHDMGEGCHP